MTTSLFFLVWALATALAVPLLLPFCVRGLAGARAFAAANVLAVLSLLASACAGVGAQAACMAVADASWLFSMGLVHAGLRQFFGLRPWFVRIFALAGGCLAGIGLLGMEAGHLAGRIVLYSSYTCAAMTATGALIRLQRHQIQTRGVVPYLLISVFGLAALHFLRVVVYGSGLQAPGPLEQPTPWGLFFIVCGSVTVPALFLALLLLLQTRMSERMQAALTFDTLTQAYTRGSILDELGRELRRCARGEGKLAVLVLDIDHFKSINDRYGHAAGDAALRHFARVVQRAVRASDRFGRLGGEEFVLLMYDCEPARALVHAQRVCDALRDAPFYLQGIEVPMTASGGLASYQPGDTADVILANADAALYQAKRLGRDRVEMAWKGCGAGLARFEGEIAPAAHAPLAAALAAESPSGTTA
ncbi:GGDEF domain-containing protein [Achromobacter sp. Marseille-Q4962]|uniref:GGDEF domain-containing protein n=1 Tax=Achromobacter sp. Marseille-Q4962 TaxID=2942202 RepID=UPI002073744C|nr:GGDEF domain-containing protein [Achromobacter sp. Marseille-Q4962]